MSRGGHYFKDRDSRLYAYVTYHKLHRRVGHVPQQRERFEDGHDARLVLLDARRGRRDKDGLRAAYTVERLKGTINAVYQKKKTKREVNTG